MDPMMSLRPYLLRAYYDWITDSNLTPYVVVDAVPPTVKVPTEYIENGRITLNISQIAVNNLNLQGAKIEFDASFGGQVHHIYAPISAILAVYAQENGRGIVFAESGLPEEEDDIDLDPEQLPPPDDGNDGDGGNDGSGGSGKPNLRIVK